MNNVKKITYTYFLLVFVFLFVIFNSIYSINKNLEVIFLDIGQGDGILIKTPSGFRIVIDGGPDDSLIYRISNYLNYFNREIDLIVLTHPDSDHVTGLGELFSRYKVKHVLLTGQQDDLPVYEFLLKESKKTKIFYTQNIDTIVIDDFTRLDILYPKSSNNFSNNNDSSVVVKLQYKDSTFLFTGDVTQEVEQLLLDKDIKSNVLKIAHHGSKTSSGLEFLREVNPSYAVIQSGQNKYGHPHQVVLDRLEDLGIKYLITRELGDIVLLSNGSQIWLKD